MMLEDHLGALNDANYCMIRPDERYERATEYTQLNLSKYVIEDSIF